jgi:cob(I)alamin adenosyltransferase
MSSEEERWHKERAQKHKAAVDARIIAADRDKGLLLVLTGNGKGKSSSAFGMVARTLGYGRKAAVFQFIKGAENVGERAFFASHPDVTWEKCGEGFTWETQDRARDVAAAERAWAATKRMMANPAIRLIVLDELNIALRYDHLDVAEVVATLQARRRDQHIVVTGRNAKPEMIEAADLVTEMTPVKHHFAAGVKAQEGIEF